MNLEIHYVVTYRTGRVKRFWSQLDVPVGLDTRVIEVKVDSVRVDGKLVAVASEKEVIVAE